MCVFGFCASDVTVTDTNTSVTWIIGGFQKYELPVRVVGIVGRFEYVQHKAIAGRSIGHHYTYVYVYVYACCVRVYERIPRSEDQSSECVCMCACMYGRLRGVVVDVCVWKTTHTYTYIQYMYVYVQIYMRMSGTRSCLVAACGVVSGLCVLLVHRIVAVQTVCAYEPDSIGWIRSLIMFSCAPATCIPRMLSVSVCVRRFMLWSVALIECVQNMHRNHNPDIGKVLLLWNFITTSSQHPHHHRLLRRDLNL